MSVRRHVSCKLKMPSLGLFGGLSSPLRCQICSMTLTPSLEPLWCLSSSVSCLTQRLFKPSQLCLRKRFVKSSYFHSSS
ncbi:UNVERIFIED_CONTAM: hypothetical protein NCL1_63608 [Trichonephila clavipes]